MTEKKKLEKLQKLEEITDMLNKIYPDIDRMIIFDLENPKQIMFTSLERALELAEEMEMEYYDSESQELIEFNPENDPFGDDEGNGGILQ